MRLSVVVQTVGQILCYFALIMFLPLVVDWLYGGWFESLGFLIAGTSAALTGVLLRRIRVPKGELARVEGLAVVALVWLVVALFGSIPYLWARLGPVDAFFESMSGFTTTGATVFTDFSLYSRGLFFWRGLTQWLGGMGVLALFIAVLPALAVAGRQLFFAEAPGPSEERLTPRIRNTAIALWSLYAGLSALETVALRLTGMPLYDSICNTFTTMAAGGFSPNPYSIGGYANPAAEWVIILFMFLAGANYSLQYQAVRGHPGALLKDEEFRVYTGLVLAAALVLFLVLLRFAARLPADYLASESGAGALSGASPFDAVRHALFQVLSIFTTTGFATDDFNLWSEPARLVLLVLMFIGGCAGSAAGGPKVVRHWLTGKHALGELLRALHPRVVRPIRLGPRVVPPEVIRSITAFMLLYLLIFTLSTLIVVILGADILTGLTASIATLGNIGPGFGGVGPMAGYAWLHPVSKLVLTINMWVGRLEVMTVLVLLQPEVWRSMQWSDPRHRRRRAPAESIPG
jgi:trk system potassium uptake protein TrkH